MPDKLDLDGKPLALAHHERVRDRERDKRWRRRERDEREAGKIYRARPSQAALLEKRKAARYADRAAKAGDVEAPWAIRNVRLWQSYMVRAMAERSRIIREYLEGRGRRLTSAGG